MQAMLLNVDCESCTCSQASLKSSVDSGASAYQCYGSPAWYERQCLPPLIPPWLLHRSCFSVGGWELQMCCTLQRCIPDLLCSHAGYLSYLEMHLHHSVRMPTVTVPRTCIYYKTDIPVVQLRCGGSFCLSVCQ